MSKRIWIAACLFASALPTQAAEDLGKAKEMNILEIVIKGGPMMIPLGLISIIALVLVLLYLMVIRRNAVVSDRFMHTTELMLRKRDFLGLIEFCHRQNQSMARIVEKSLDFMTRTPSATFQEVREIAEAEGSRQAGILNSRISYLADIGSISPMVGLLGTVLGMITSFMEISSGDIQGVRQMELANGVYQALVTTAAGLAIGIPALVFYSFFRGRVQRYVAELEAAATHYMALLHSQLDRQPAPMSGYPAAPPMRTREDYTTPLSSVLGGERPDLHGI